jgi:Ser/Thr protein kinase RdoA (MazF antagonist)
MVEYYGWKAVLRVWKLSTRAQAIAEPAALFAFIDGEHPPNRLAHELSEEHLALASQMGRLIGRVHVSLAGLSHLPYREQSYTNRLREREKKARSLDLAGPVRERVNRILSTIAGAEYDLARQASEGRLQVGVVHDDPGPWNVLVRDGSVNALLDFDIIHRDLLVYDLAHVITQWAAIANSSVFHGYDGRAVCAIVAGYESVRKLSGSERGALARAVPLRSAIDLLLPLGDVLALPDWDFEEYLDRFDVLSLLEDPAWHDIFM